MRFRWSVVAVGVALLVVTSAFMPVNAATSGFAPGINWSGYVADVSDVTAVSGEFVVPTVQQLTPGFVGEWVGVGGYNTGDLIQAGTGQEYVPGSGVQYYAWWETLPDVLTRIDNPVAPGDHMTVVISNRSGDQWDIHIVDATQGWTFDRTVHYGSSRSSAEWIVEAPQISIGGLPLGIQSVPPIMGPVVFDGAGNNATIGGATKKLGDTAPVELILSVATVKPSELDSDGDGFAVCEYSITCNPPAS